MRNKLSDPAFILTALTGFFAGVAVTFVVARLVGYW
jgi:hypothetical protein